MDKILNVIKRMKQSNYFDAWTTVLLGDSSAQEWQLMLEDSHNDNLYLMLAIKLHEHNVPYVVVSEYIDEFFRYCDKDTSRHLIKNRIAKAYLNKKLLDDMALIDIELNKKITVSLESKQDLINAHMKWMKHFIFSIVGTPHYFELDPTKCFVGKWLIEEKENVDILLVQKHKNLHSMAQSALRMHKQEDYAYFLLLYTDIFSSSYQIRDTILNIYFSRRLTSIYKDPLTNQFNYFQLKEDILKNESQSTILMFNIKEFKKINLLYGHEIGDKIIKNIGKIISSFKNITNCYRIYGDEFAMIFPTQKRDIVLTEFKEKLYNYEYMSESEIIPISFYASVANTAKHILEYCEYGLILSKVHYGDIVDIDTVDKKMFQKYAGEISTSQKLKLAFLDNRIITYFQPILDLKRHEITKYEVLMRLQDIDDTILSPIDFLDVLKKMYMYPEVSKLIIKNSFEFFRDEEYEFSINLSYADIINEDTKAFILKILQENIEVASRCTFELLENDAILNAHDVGEFFAALHSFGVKIALDDFGAGYSNYDVIFKFDIDYIKIDGSLVESIITSEKSRTLIESIISVSRKMDTKIIVEYVSSAEIFKVIKGMDIDYAQGFYIGKPRSGLELEVE